MYEKYIFVFIFFMLITSACQKDYAVEADFAEVKQDSGYGRMVTESERQEAKKGMDNNPRNKNHILYCIRAESTF